METHPNHILIMIMEMHWKQRLLSSCSFGSAHSISNVTNYFFLICYTCVCIINQQIKIETTKISLLGLFSISFSSNWFRCNFITNIFSFWRFHVLFWNSNFVNRAQSNDCCSSKLFNAQFNIGLLKRSLLFSKLLLTVLRLLKLVCCFKM